jgi:murein DD-endopeptidase MepM/ murein hydrolase activator NlpD
MKPFLYQTGALVAALLAGACTTYQPLGAGSSVPWAPVLARGGEPVQSGSGLVMSGDRGRIGVRPVAVAEVPRADLSGQVHRVEQGEALALLARRYDVTMTELAEINRLKPPYTIYVGQVLRLPEGAAPSAPVVASAQRHTVRSGENLTGIARTYGVSMAAIVELNELKSANAIFAGQELRLPQPGASQLAARAGAETGAAVADSGYLWPLKGKVIGRFGRTAAGEVHQGIAIAARKGTPVRAAQAGVVVYAGDAIRGYGRMVLLRHDDGYVTAYAHNSALLVNVGETVGRGEVIARVGDTGGVAQAQLHFEIRKGRQPIDPETILADEPTALASSQ